MSEKRYTEFLQQPGRSETVTFGGSLVDVLPDQLEKLGVKKVFVVASKSLAEHTSELETLQNIPAVKQRLAGTKIGVHPHGYVVLLSD
jgi:hypothetical protein